MAYVETPLHLSLSGIASLLSDEKLVVADASPTLYSYSIDGELLSHASIGGFEMPLYRYSRSIAISLDERYALMCDAGGAKALLIDITSKKLALNIKMQKDPKFALFSGDNLYFLVANSVGRVMLYELSTLELYDEFAFADEFADAKFSSDGTKLLVSTLNRMLYVYDIASKSIEQKIELVDIADLISLASDQSCVLLFLRSGQTLRYQFHNSSFSQADAMYEWGSILTHSANKRVVLVGTRSSQLFVYTANRGTLLGALNFEFWGVSTLSVCQERLFIGFSDGNALLIDASEEIAKAKELLETKEIERLSLLVGESPLLFLDSSFCDMLQEGYESVLEYKPLGAEERKGYDAMIAYLLSDERSQKELLRQLYGSMEIVSFTQELESGNSKEACELAYEAPLLRQLKEYSALRTHCYKEIAKELKMLEQNPYEFSEYLQRQEKSCLACKHGVVRFNGDLVEAYKKLRGAAEAMSFATLFEIVSLYPLFRQTKIFARMMHYGESLIDKTLIMLHAGKTDEALKYATKLALIKPFAKTGDDFKKQIKLQENFQKACERENIEQICTIVKEHPQLRTTQLFKAQIARYNEHVKPAFAIAFSGDVQALIKHLGKYFNVEYFKAKNQELKRLALLYEIKNYAPLGEEEALLNDYYRCFGWDEHYENVSKFFGLEPRKEIKEMPQSGDCIEQMSFLRGVRVKRKDHFKVAGGKE